MTNEFEDNPDNGITLGLEEALQREIEKSKSLKVERLKLRDKIEQLREENKSLLKEITKLRDKARITNPKPSEEENWLGQYFPQNILVKLVKVALVLTIILFGWFFYFVLPYKDFPRLFN